MVHHLEQHRLIRTSQHGFMRGKSCTTNLLSFLEKVTTAVDNGDSVDVIFLDFAKAFDKVPVERLLKKVLAHGIGGKILSWIAAWLRERSQRVVLNGKASTWRKVLSGVPQGSVLGPLLFVLFINDLEENVADSIIIRKFADDTKAARTVTNQAEQAELQLALDKLVDWSTRWGMAFNVAKCKVMHIGHTNQQRTYTMEGKVLETTEEERDLGVIMTRTLKPSAQCKKAARTAQTVLNQISRAFHYRDRAVFVKLYKQYVRPHLEFAGQAWSPWTEADRTVLERVQQRAIRMVSGLESQEYEARLKELGMTTLVERRHQADMAMVHKMQRERDTVDPGEWFEPAGNVTGRLTRVAADPLNVKVKHGRLDIRKNFFSVRTTESWNKIPGPTKLLRTADSFKNAYAKLRQNM